jgi:RNA polymerase sigma-70 factor (ECF subfamily)
MEAEVRQGEGLAGNGSACRSAPSEAVSDFGELTKHLSRRRIVMTRSLDDHSLVAACRAGQTEAFGALVLRYQERLYQTILRLTGSAEDANDVLQDTFLRAFEKLDQFHGDSSFYTWVYRIAVNLALTGYRRRRARSLLKGRGAFAVTRTEGSIDLSAEADPTFPLERAERERIVEAALNELGADHRAVVVMKDFDGRRYEEISAILNVPVGTVRSRLHRARGELRDRLKSLVEEEQPVRQTSTNSP